MKQFNYHEPKTIKEACSLLSQYGDRARVLAGGTDLIPKMKAGSMAPDHLVNIKKVSGLDFLKENKKGLHIGALTLIAEMGQNTLIRDRFPILGIAASSIGSLQVRNLATLGGNICNAASSADMVPGLLVLNAILTLTGTGGDREIPIENFFAGYGQVALKRGEMLTGVYVPFSPSNARQNYVKHMVRRSMEIALAGVAVCLAFETKTGRCNYARIALGAVAPAPIRAKKTEKMILGKSLDELDLDLIRELVRTEASPISDVRGSAEYRLEIVSTLTARAIKSLAN